MPPSSRSTWSLWGGRVLGFLPGALVVLLSALLLAGLALPGATAQAAQGRAKQLPNCATVTETGSCRPRRERGLPSGLWHDQITLTAGRQTYLPSHPEDPLIHKLLLVLKNPTVTVQQDGEAAVEVSPKQFAKQFAATYGQSVPSPSDNVDWGFDRRYLFWSAFFSHRGFTLREETYKKSKKTGTEKLRCKLDGLDAEIVDDLVGLPGPVPCTLKFQTPCFRGERP